MPVTSMFYGIIIRMYFLDNQHHGESVVDWLAESKEYRRLGDI